MTWHGVVIYYTCRDCGYVTVVTSPKPETVAGPILCGSCGSTKGFRKEERAA